MSSSLSIAAFAKKLATQSTTFPEDYTIGALANVVSSMAQKKTLITQSEVKELFRRFYSRNTKFAHLFADELGIPVPQDAAPRTPRQEEGTSLLKDAAVRYGDPVLANALDRAFGTKVKPFSTLAAEKARSVVQAKLLSCGLSAAVEASTGNEELLICSAHFQTPKGKTTVLIPVEIRGKFALLPSVFVSNAGSQELSSALLQDYVLKNAGSKLSLSAKTVFDAITGLRKSADDISDVDIALTKFNATKEKAKESDIKGFHTLPQEPRALPAVYSRDPEMDSIASKFDGNAGTAFFTFGETATKLAGTMLEGYMRSFGYVAPRIVVASSDEKSITYGISLEGGRVAFKVPMKIDNGRPVPPKVILANGYMEDFSFAGISRVANNGTDNSVAAMASVMNTLPDAKLVDVVRDAAAAKDFRKAEEAIAVLADKGNPKAYKAAVQAFQDGLAAKPAEQHKCAFVIKNSTSQYPICGHTGLPLSKVKTDKYGNCVPAHRKEMDESMRETYGVEQ